MKKLYVALTLPVVCSAMVACSSTKSSQPKPGPGYVVKGAGSFKLQPYKEVRLENDLRVVFIKDTTLPRISMTLLVKSGNVQEPSDRAGLNALTSYLLEQGTQSRPALKIADEFGQLGASLEITPGSDFTTIYSDSLSSDGEVLLDLFSDVAMNPAFQDREIPRIRSQMLAGLQKKIDNPSSFADERMDQFVFGNHPYGRDVNGTSEGLKAATKQDIIKHYLTFFRPNNSSLAIVGNFDEAFEAKVKETFGKWTKRTVPEAQVEAAPASDKLQVRLIVKKGLQQTQIRIAQLGIARNDADFLPLRLGNEAVGGSFASRLNQKVRDDLGLTYSIYSYFDVRKDKGSFDISTFTKNETAGKTLEETLNVLNDYVTNGAKDTEVKASRNQLIGQFPRAIETADRLAFNLLALEFYGIPVDYLTTYNKKVSGLSAKETNKAFQKAVTPNNFKVLVYGDEKIIPQFEKFNPEIIRIK